MNILQSLLEHVERQGKMIRMLQEKGLNRPIKEEPWDSEFDGKQWWGIDYKLPKFNGFQNPRFHANDVIEICQEEGVKLENLAYVFPRTLEGGARAWYFTLPATVINSWGIL